MAAPVPQGEPSPPRGDPWEPELLEAHQRHVAEIRARTQQLEQQRERRHRHRVWGDRCGSGVTQLCVPQSCASAWHCCATTVCHQKRAGLRRRCQTKLDTSTEGEPCWMLPRNGLPLPAGPQFAHILPRAALHLDTLLLPSGSLSAEAR